MSTAGVAETPSRRSSTEAKVRVAFIGALVALALAVVASYAAMRATVDASRWVEHTLAVEHEIATIVSALSLEESETRYYALTGDERAIVEVALQWNAAESHAAALSALTRDNLEQQRSSDALRGQIASKRELDERIIAARRADGLVGITALVESGEARRRMTAVRETLRAMESAEHRLLEERERRASSSVAFATASFVALGALALFILSAGYVVVRKEVHARRVALETAQASEERFRVLVDGVRDYGIYLLDPNGIVTSWNAGAERLKGYSAAEIVGKTFSVFYPPEDIAAGRPARELAFAAEHDRYEETALRVRKDGRTFWANIILTALRHDGGTLRGFAKITRDVSEKKQAETALFAANAALQRSNRELQEFAMIASHDLQEPLRKVQMFGDRLREDFSEGLGDKGRNYIARMQSAAVRCQTLIQGLLTYSRVTMKSEPFAEVDLAPLAREVVGDLEVRIAEQRARVEIGSLPTIEADPLQMRQLLQNLIGNALKFAKEGVAPVVRVSSSASNGELDREGFRLVVSDNGIGFDPKYVDRIFKLFQRLHARGTYEGTGMGLAICRKIVERHHGDLTATSAPGEGSTFIVCLPAHQPRE